MNDYLVILNQTNLSYLFNIFYSYQIYKLNLNIITENKKIHVYNKNNIIMQLLYIIDKIEYYILQDIIDNI